MVLVSQILTMFAEMESTEGTGCQAPEGSVLCINNCGFFGSSATMNMCSKCHKDMIMKEQQSKLAVTSIDSIVNGSSSNQTEQEHIIDESETVKTGVVEQLKSHLPQPVFHFGSGQNTETKKEQEQAIGEDETVKTGVQTDLPQPKFLFGFGQNLDTKSKEKPKRCSVCNKRVGLIGFKCRCKNLFCSVHRYSDKHDCPYDYRAAAKDAIAKANPLVKPKKLEMI